MESPIGMDAAPIKPAPPPETEPRPTGVRVASVSPINGAHRRLSEKQRAKQTNQIDRLVEADGNSAPARRFRDVAGQLIADAGGPDAVTEARLQLTRRFAAVSVIAEQLEVRMLSGEPIDPAEHALLVSSAVRLVAKLGIGRVPRNVTPTLSDYLSGLAETKPGDAGETKGDAEGDNCLTDEAAE
jgi:hypothetical protein